MIETLDDIVEELADKFGIYGCGPENGDHPEKCDCRICFTSWMNTRILRAVEVGKRLEYATDEHQAGDKSISTVSTGEGRMP